MFGRSAMITSAIIYSIPDANYLVSRRRVGSRATGCVDESNIFTPWSRYLPGASPGFVTLRTD